MKKIFLTGGTGFVGKSILDCDAFRNAEITILSRDPESFCRKHPCFSGYRFRKGDVRDFVFPREEFDWILHGAATSGKPVSDDEMRSVIVDGTCRILKFAEMCHAKRLLYVSSGAVYGMQDPGLYGIPETYPANPVTVYGKAKLEAEKMCLASKNSEIVIARCFAFIGKYLPRTVHFASGNFLEDVLHDRPVTIKGDGKDYRSYLDQDDLARAFYVLLERGKAGEIYNVGGEEALTIRELAERIVEISGKDLPVRVLNPSERTGARYVPDTAKISKLFRPSVTLDESIRKIL